MKFVILITEIGEKSMKKITVILIVILAAIMLISCPGIGEDPPKDDPAPPVLSNNAALSGLTITTGSVDHVYTTIESSYSLTISNAVDSITVTPILSDTNAGLTINGVPLENISITIPISVGDNTFTLVVTAEDGETTLSYPITIERLDGTVPDTAAPVIALSGDNPMTVEVDTTYIEPGYSALDTIEGDLTNAVVVTGSINSNTVGTYILLYNVSDTSGNAAVEVSRTVNVAESLEAPTISLESGTYTSAQTVTITHPNPNVNIRYTIDNTWIPSDGETMGSLYTGDITVSDPTTLIARAFLDGFNPSSGTREDYAIVSAGETNLIANGDFSFGLSLWQFWDYNQSNAEASFSVESGIYTVNISNGGDNDWHVATDYGPRFLLEQNEYYQLDFTAWADSARQIGFHLQENGIDNNGDGGSYSSYYGTTIDLTTSPQIFSFQMRMDDIDDSHADLRFNLGIETVDVYIDEISLEKIIPVLLTTTNVPDANLRAAFEDATGKTFGIDLTDMDLLLLDELVIPDYGITDLTGLEFCDNVGFLLLNGNLFVSLIPVEGMERLSAIDLWGCEEISDISVLANLSGLTHIKVARNDLDINDYSIFTHDNFPNLIRLAMDGYDETTGQVLTNKMDILTFLSDHSGLEELTLYRFFLSHIEFIDLYNQVLIPNNSSLDGLFLDHNNLTNDSLTLVSNLNNLTRLEVSNNSDITNISAFANMSNLRFLDLNGTGVADISPLEDLYDNGGFSLRSNDDYDILINNCNLDLWPGSSNRDVVDYLIDQGVRVDYEEGNQLIETPAVYTPGETSLIVNYTYTGNYTVDVDHFVHLHVSHQSDMMGHRDPHLFTSTGTFIEENMIPGEVSITMYYHGDGFSVCSYYPENIVIEEDYTYTLTIEFDDSDIIYYTYLDININNFPSDGNHNFMLRSFIDSDIHNNCGSYILVTGGSGSSNFTAGEDWIIGTTYSYILWNDTNQNYEIDSGEYQSSFNNEYDGSDPVELTFSSWTQN